MPLVLLLTLDPGLEREIEKALGTEAMLCLGSTDEVASTVGHLDTSFILVVDSSCYPPPPCPEADLIVCVGEEIVPGTILLERPVRGKELLSLLQGAGGLTTSSSSDPVIPSPIAEFQRDAVHDLKNQLTTIQGNLMLLQEDMTDEGIDDMVEAAKKALNLSEWLGLLGDGDFGSQRIELNGLVRSLHYFFHRLRDRETTFELQNAADDVFIYNDPKKLLILLLLLVQHLPGHPRSCQLIVTSQPKGAQITASWTEAPFSKSLPDTLSGLASKMGGNLLYTDTSWTLEFGSPAYT